nr:SgcJ/EcaC family oxidoreductase [uncultured Actinoplanes sp.]
MNNEEKILQDVLDRWKSGIEARNSREVAGLFTEDGIFQGLHPYSVGREGVAEYYDSQPVGLTADYRFQETRRLSDDVVLGYVAVEFGFTDRDPLPVNLTVVAVRDGSDWRLAHYHVSRIIP